MLKVVTSNNSSIFRQMASPAFQRVGVEHFLARDGIEAMELVRRHRPDMVILDTELAGRSGYEVCRAIKDDEDLARIRVVLVVDRGIDSGMIKNLSWSRCDEVLVTPAPGEELFHKVARLLGLPSRQSRRLDVEMRAVLASGATVISGVVLDLSPEGARLELERSTKGAKTLKMRISSGDRQGPLVVDARPIWEDVDKDRRVTCGVQFIDVPAPVRAVLEDWALWDIAKLDDVTQVFLQGEFREHTDFGRLAEKLTGRVEFDLSRVKYLNSAGVRKWVDFLRSLDDHVDYSFVRCSVAFVMQAAMVPEVLGGGRVESFNVPYACDTCDLEQERLLQTSALVVEGVWPPDVPSFVCPRCGADLLFDDLPGRFFAFLEQDGRFGGVG
ncbi:MAG: PilZ domain-containing protein [Deltaproteobacteria bacterium]|nr:PilZ domain-containing protein [Deltaproteobacteria bacterium]